MATATAKRNVKVKTSTKTAATRRSRPLDREQIEAIVAEAVYMNDPLVRAYNGTAALSASAATAASSALQSVLDGLAHVAGQVWVFLNEVYSTVIEYTAAVLNWIGEQVAYAYGKAKQALEYVYEFVGSMSVDWIAVNGHIVNLMCAAAAIGIGVTVGGAVGLTMGGIIAADVGPGLLANVATVLFGATAAGCTAEVAYTLFKSGVPRTVIIEGLHEAESRPAFDHTSGRGLPSHAVTPAGVTC